MENKLIEPVKRGSAEGQRGISQVICLRIDSNLLDKVDSLADQHAVTRSSVIIHALKALTK